MISSFSSAHSRGTSHALRRQFHFHSSSGIVLLLYLFLISLLTSGAAGGVDVANVIYAVNAGGDAHTDINGVQYKRDPLSNLVGIASDYGKQLSIQRVHPQDQILYQTERYHTQTFGYNIPVKEDGDYVIVLKFSEVYFNAAGMKVFDVVLNNDHSIVSDLDIYAQVGQGVAYDEIVEFTVSEGMLKVQGEDSPFDGTLRVDFIKGSRDNPKINSILVLRGTSKTVPPLAPIKPGPDGNDAPNTPYPSDGVGRERVDPKNDIDNDEEVPEKRVNPKRLYKPPGPKVADPYAADDTATLFPLLIAIGAFIPLLFCLCKL